MRRSAKYTMDARRQRWLLSVLRGWRHKVVGESYTSHRFQDLLSELMIAAGLYDRGPDGVDQHEPEREAFRHVMRHGEPGPPSHAAGVVYCPGCNCSLFKIELARDGVCIHCREEARLARQVRSAD